MHVRQPTKPSLRPVAILAVGALLAILGAGCTADATSTDPPPPVAVPNAVVPYDGLLAGGQPTDEQLRQAAEAGFVSVINIRTAGETGYLDQAQLVQDLGMRYLHVPVAGLEDLDREAVRRVAAEIERAGGEPVLLHCASGRRVSALVTLKAAWVDGMSREAALEVGRRSRLSAETEKSVVQILDAAGK
jgi:uncharacterized protein (TIGR01244 family)